jgi:hypothetical protein
VGNVPLPEKVTFEPEILETVTPMKEVIPDEKVKF